jgi:succinate dehydrogenase hydrophobic anchor subunit
LTLAAASCTIRVVTYESSRRALRGATLPLLGGFLLMIVSIGLWVASTGIEAVGTLSNVLGALGSGVLLMGALRLARVSIAGRPSFWLIGFFLFWLGELVLRLWALAGVEDPLRLRAIRILIGAAAMICLSSGVRKIWTDGVTWSATRWLFALQITAVAGLTVSGVPKPSDSLLGQTIQAAIWLAFAVPYAHVILSIRRTVRWLSGSDTVAEILTS